MGAGALLNAAESGSSGVAMSSAVEAREELEGTVALQGGPGALPSAAEGSGVVALSSAPPRASAASLRRSRSPSGVADSTAAAALAGADPASDVHVRSTRQVRRRVAIASNTSYVWNREAEESDTDHEVGECADSGNTVMTRRRMFASVPCRPSSC